MSSIHKHPIDLRIYLWITRRICRYDIIYPRSRSKKLNCRQTGIRVKDARRQNNNNHKKFKNITWKKWKLVFGISVSRRYMAVAECADSYRPTSSHVCMGLYVYHQNFVNNHSFNVISVKQFKSQLIT